MADRPNPYVRKDPGDIIRSGDWNELQIKTREEILAHDHSGSDKGTQIPRTGIVPKAIDGSLIDPEASVTVKNLNATNLTIKGQEILGDIQNLLDTVKSLSDNKVNKAGDTVTGALAINSDLTVSGKLSVTGSSEIATTNGIRFNDGNRTQHINVDGSLYRYQGQCYLTVDDNFYVRSTNDNKMFSVENGNVTVSGLLTVNNNLTVSGKITATSGTLSGNLTVNDMTVNSNLIVKSSGITLGLENSGGGKLVIANNPNDNRIYLEAFSTDGKSSAAELLLTGRNANNIPQLSLLADKTNINGDLDVRGKLTGSLFSSDGIFKLCMQSDSNLVVYKNETGAPLWSWINGKVSDIKLKENLNPIQNALQKVLSLRGVLFDWKDENLGKNRQIGVIAQDVEQVFPELVTDFTSHKLVNYEGLIPALIEAIKEQQQQINKLTAQLHA